MTAIAFDGTGALTAPWAGEQRYFRLTIGALRELDVLLCEPFTLVVERIVQGGARFHDIRHIFYHGLVGGGMDRSAAHALCCKEIDAAPLYMLLPLADMAAVILTAGMSSGPRSADSDEELPVATGEPKRIGFDTILRFAGAIGIPVPVLNEMSIWEFEQQLDGWIKANGVEQKAEPPEPSEERFDEVMRD